MKRHLEEFFTISLLSSLLILIAVYLTAYSWLKGGFDFVELAHMRKIYGNFSFVLIILTNSFLLPVYLVRCYKKKLSYPGWVLQVFFLALGNVTVIILLDAVVAYATGNRIATEYFTSLEYMVTEKLIPDEGFDYVHLSSSSFFHQHRGFTIIMIVLGNLTGVLTARFMVSRKSFL
jgi:hypothetical protein